MPAGWQSGLERLKMGGMRGGEVAAVEGTAIWGAVHGLVSGYGILG